MDVASRIGFGNEEGCEMSCSVDEDLESKDLDTAVIVADRNTQEVASTGGLVRYVAWWSGVEGRGGSGRGAEVVDDETLLLGQRCC